MPSPESEVRLILEATVSPSEDPLKVAKAVASIAGLGPEAASVGPKAVRLVTGERKALAHVRDQLRDRHIRSAARRQLLLNRQAAAAGVVAVCGGPEESPLGPIYLTLSSGKLDEAIDWLTAYPDG